MSRPERGRYDGDLYAELQFNPVASWPYRVKVWEWVEFLPTVNPERPNPRDYWTADRSSILSDYSNRDFKSLSRATRYLHKAMRDADEGAYRRVVNGRTEAEWVTL